MTFTIFLFILSTVSEGTVYRHKYLEIAEAIRHDIVAGAYEIGEKIPPIRRLSEKYGVNPQTVNKATAYLASLGYLKPRQGAGSVVTIPHDKEPTRYIGMLVDQSRSHWLTDQENPENSHSRDIYFSYFMMMNRNDINADFIIYDKRSETVPEEFKEKVLKASGFFVQGSLPRCYLQYLGEHDIPTVLINRSLPSDISGKFGSVLISEEKMEDLVNYIVSLGHTKLLFAFSQEFEQNEVFSRRLARLEKAVDGWRGELDLQLERFCFDIEDAEAARELEGYLDSGFSAAFGYNDVSALRMYELVGRVGRDIPEDLSVVGFDDILAANLASPPLTTIRVNRAALVEEGFEIIQELKPRRSPMYLEKTLKPDLVIRKSVFVKK